MDITYRVSKYIAEARFKDIPDNVKRHAKLCILDWIGSALAGVNTDIGEKVLSLIHRFGDEGSISIVGRCIKAPLLYAAFINGVLGHAVEMDDIHRESIIHPAASILPASLALGEDLDAGGDELILSTIVGYEVGIRIGMAVNPSHYRYWHTTGTCGTFAAAAAVGKMLELDIDKIMNMLGIAGTLASGMTYVFGTMAKPINPGAAAMNGILAGLLADMGLETIKNVFDVENGFLNATSSEPKSDLIVKDLGTRYEILNNIFKIHASCGHTHAAIDATLDILDRYDIKPKDVKEIHVGIYPLALDKVGKIKYPNTPEEGKFSLTYCIASAVLYRKVGLDEFTMDKLSNREVHDLIGKIRIYIDDSCRGSRLGCSVVKIITSDGREYISRVDKPKGYPENPLTREDLIRKFRALAEKTLDDKSINDVIYIIENLEEYRVRDLIKAINGCG